MTCPRCQQQSPPDADFCPHCGAKLAAVCVHCGTEPGKPADIIAVRTRNPSLLPWHDPVADLVYAARGSDVVAVFVNGEHLVRGGRPLKLDAERILADATQAVGRLTNVGA